MEREQSNARYDIIEPVCLHEHVLLTPSLGLLEQQNGRGVVQKLPAREENFEPQYPSYETKRRSRFNHDVDWSL